MKVAAEQAYLPLESMERLSGFGMVSVADGYVYRPTELDGIRAALRAAKGARRKLVQRGAGQSYGDANIASEAVVLDLTRMNRILNWNPATGVLEAEPGVTIEDLWRKTLPDFHWPPVVSGTMRPTLGGALAMNIHGKNAFRQGPIGEHVLELDLMDTLGKVHTLKPEDDLFKAAVGGVGLVGVITRVQLQMHRVSTGNVEVLPVSCPNLAAQFAAFEKHEGDADYMVSWVDCFATGTKLGRGLFHAAWYTTEGARESLDAESQDLPSTIMGVLPKSAVWHFLKPLNNRFCMRFLNAAKQVSAKLHGDGKAFEQSLVAFSFLLDYVPNWRNAYLPGGFIQHQCFVPRERASEVFARLIAMEQESRLESFLTVMKRHRPDGFLLTHGVDGYSLAQDFKVTEANWGKLQGLCHRMNDVVLEAGGRFYFAKDLTLRPSDVAAFLGDDALAKFRSARTQMDPNGLLTSALADRVGLNKLTQP